MAAGSTPSQGLPASQCQNVFTGSDALQTPRSLGFYYVGAIG